MEPLQPGASPAAPASTAANRPPCSTEHQFTLGGAFRFEVKSLLGRWFLERRPPVLAPGAQLINLGCGDNLAPGFVNADFFRLRRPAPAAHFWGIDLRYPLPCPADHWDGVFTEHTLEHLYPDRVRALLAEIHRTLKPGAWLRIIVPDLRRYVDYYVGRPSHPALERWKPRGAALRSVAQNYLHVSLWDDELLAEALTGVGFVAITPRSFRAGADPRLLIDAPAREYESLYLEAQKPQ